jgi:hypothetical protein
MKKNGFNVVMNKEKLFKKMKGFDEWKEVATEFQLLKSMRMACVCDG